MHNCRIMNTNLFDMKYIITIWSRFYIFIILMSSINCYNIMKQCLQEHIDDRILYKHEILKETTHIIFGRRFNQYVNNLSETVTHIKFGYFFNQ